jgi:hypothetical protein
MKTRIIVLIMCAFLASACRNLEIVHVSPNNPAKPSTKEGIYYALPLTVLTVEVPVTKITLTPGACFCEDKELMRSKGEIINELIKLQPVPPKNPDNCEEEMKFGKTFTYYKLGTIAISGYPAPDTSKIFFVKTRKNAFKKTNLTFSLNELGVMNSAEIKVEDRTLDVITQITGSVVEVVGKLLKGDTTKSGKPLDRKSTCKKLRGQLNDIAAARQTLINSTTMDKSIETFNRQLEELNKAQEAIVAQFTFSEEKETSLIKIDRIIRISELNSWIDLFDFDKTSGLKLLPLPQAGYTNYYYNNSVPSITNSEKDRYALQVQAYDQQMATYVGQHSSGMTLGNQAGLAYNVPKKAAIKIAKVKVANKNVAIEKVVASSNSIMPQFGTVAFLRRKQSLANIELDPFSGALRKISIENNGITAEQIKNLGTVASSVAGLKKTELSELQQEATILEQKEKILKLKISIDSLAKTQQ